MTMEEFTTPKKEMQVSDALRLLTRIVDSMEDAGIRIISARASGKPGILVLDADEHLRLWAAENELVIAVEKYEPKEDITDSHWRLTTEISGVEISTYLSDKEKEAWDNEAV